MIGGNYWKGGHELSSLARLANADYFWKIDLKLFLEFLKSAESLNMTRWTREKLIT